MKMRPTLILSFALSLAAFTMTPAGAATAPVGDFTQLTNGVFVDVTSSSVLSPITVNGVTITAANGADGGFAGYDPGLASDPGDGNGFLYQGRSSFHPPYLQVIFNPAVAAVGVTFRHFPATQEPVVGSHSPAMLEAFTDPGLSGSLDTVSSSGMIGFDSSMPDFVGIWSDSANIRSIKLTGTNGSTPSFAVDGYAFSTTPLPEPSLICGVVAFVAAGCLRRRRLSPANGTS